MKIVSNCPLCEEKSLHVLEEDGIGTQQCINCGYATTNNLIGEKGKNEMYSTLPEDMQFWSIENGGRIWIPSMITLPFGTLYPTGVKEVSKGALNQGILLEEKVMKWAFAEMVDIPEEEQKNYPIENGNGFYDKRYDTENQKVYNTFLEAMAELNQKAKDLNMNGEPKFSSDNG